MGGCRASMLLPYWVFLWQHHWMVKRTRSAGVYGNHFLYSFACFYLWFFLANSSHETVKRTLISNSSPSSYSVGRHSRDVEPPHADTQTQRRQTDNTSSCSDAHYCCSCFKLLIHSSNLITTRDSLMHFSFLHSSNSLTLVHSWFKHSPLHNI